MCYAAELVFEGCLDLVSDEGFVLLALSVLVAAEVAELSDLTSDPFEDLPSPDPLPLSARESVR